MASADILVKLNMVRKYEMVQLDVGLYHICPIVSAVKMSGLDSPKDYCHF